MFHVKPKEVKMTLKRALIVLSLILLVTLSASLLAAPFLPERVASHWDAKGEVNGYQTKTAFIWTMPVIMLLLALALVFLPLIDPLKASFMPVRSAYYWFVSGTMVFMLYIHGLTLAFNLGVKLNLMVWMLPAFGLLMLGAGFLLDRARPNWFVGIRTPWTLSSPSVWEKTHKLGGVLFKIVGVMILPGVFFPNAAIWILMVPLIGVSLFLVVYSYILFRQEKNNTA
jgi:uncharacterized membrane protein